jgi:hypothetical protein
VRDPPANSTRVGDPGSRCRGQDKRTDRRAPLAVAGDRAQAPRQRVHQTRRSHAYRCRCVHRGTAAPFPRPLTSAPGRGHDKRDHRLRERPFTRICPPLPNARSPMPFCPFDSPYLGRTRRASAPYVTPCEGRAAPAALPSFADDVASLVVVLVVSLAGSVGVAHKLNSQVRGNCDWGARARITE